MSREEMRAPLTAIDRGLAEGRRGFIAVVAFSLVINLLFLAGPLYMMQVYDRVLASRNVTTLLFLTLILAFCYAIIAALELVRSQVLIRGGVRFDRAVSADVFRSVQRASVLQPGATHAQALRDLDSIREFFTGAGLLALLDFPWVPIYMVAAFLINFWYGVFVLVAVCITFGLAAANEIATRDTLAKAQGRAIAAADYATSTFRNAEALHAMGMVEALRRRWTHQHEAVLGWQAAASSRAGFLVAVAKFHRMLTQSLVLGLGAFLVLQREISPGMMIAASIIVGRAIQPVEVAIANWKSFVGMRSAYKRVQTLLRRAPDESERIALPEPKGQLTLENVVACAPGGQTPLLRNVTFNVPAGSALAVIGASASGKSTLARVITGVWPIASGAVRLDGSDLQHWDPDALGRHIGYLPQDVELFTGSIAENIGRFSEADDSAIIEAAMLAGVHDMIQKAPEGYNTQIGEGGQALSGGQRQRIGLARALFGKPSLIVLDEPNANLDAAGDAALGEAIAALKAQRRTLIIMTHRMNVLSSVDYIILLGDGQVQLAGPRDEVIAKLGAQRAPIDRAAMVRPGAVAT